MFRVLGFGLLTYFYTLPQMLNADKIPPTWILFSEENYPFISIPAFF